MSHSTLGLLSKSFSFTLKVLFLLLTPSMSQSLLGRPITHLKLVTLAPVCIPLVTVANTSGINIVGVQTRTPFGSLLRFEKVVTYRKTFVSNVMAIYTECATPPCLRSEKSPPTLLILTSVVTKSNTRPMFKKVHLSPLKVDKLVNTAPSEENSARIIRKTIKITTPVAVPCPPFATTLQMVPVLPPSQHLCVTSTGLLLPLDPLCPSCCRPPPGLRLMLLLLHLVDLLTILLPLLLLGRLLRT